MVAGLGIGPEEQRRLCNRALATWLLSAGPPDPSLPPGHVTVGLCEHGGSPSVAVSARDGKVLALYRVVGCGGHWRLYESAPQAAPPPTLLSRLVAPPELLRAASSVLAVRTLVSREDPLGQIARAQALRSVSLALRMRSVILRADAAVLQSRSLDLLAGSSAQISRWLALHAQVSPLLAGSHGTSPW